MAAILGKLETQLLAYAQMRERQAVRTEEVAQAIGITTAQASEVLSRLARRRLVVHVHRGLYLLPSRIPPGGRWSPGEYLALATLMDDRNTKYQICRQAAFNRFGWDLQVPNRLDVYNTAIYGNRNFASSELDLIKVDPKRLGAY